MDHTVYQALIELDEKINYIHNELVKKNILPKPKEEKDAKEEKK